MNQFNTLASTSVSPRRRIRLLVSCIGMALAQWAPGLALADSAVGVDMANGNALNPPGRSTVPLPVSEDSMDTIHRSPTGQLYGQPVDRESNEVHKTDGGWTYSGSVEAGAMGGDAATRNALYRKYKDLKNGASLNYFEFDADKADTANYLSAFGGGTGQSDQFYGLRMGRYNDWKLNLFYSETMHVFSNNWKSLFSGEGTGELTTGLAKPTAVTTALTVGTASGATLPNGQIYVGPTVAAATNCSATLPCWSYDGKTYQNGFALAAINGITGTPNATTGVMPTSGTTPQSNIAKAISDKLATVPESELSLVRKKAGVRFDKTFTDYWKGYASYTLEDRKGARPFAMNEGNISTEIAEPIDYQTHEFLTGLQYADSLTQMNLRASASLFHNGIDTLNVQYPFLMAASPLGGIQTATYDLYPDNNAFNLKGEFARSLPDFYKGRFNASLAFGSSQQNNDLLSPLSTAQNRDLTANGITAFGGTANSGYATGAALVSNWNTTAALSQLTAKQRIDTKLADLGLSMRPTDDLSLKGTARYYDSSNKGGYTAYNPLTGQFGRGPVDGNAGMDMIVGLRSGATSGTAGSCYIPPGFTATAATAACYFGVTPSGATAVANGSNIPVYGQARSTQQINYGLSADYDLTRTSSLNAALEREEFTRDFRERDKTWENKIKLGYVNRSLGDATLRASVENDSKRGSVYNYRTFADLGTGLPGLDPATQVANAGTQGYLPFSPAGGTAVNIVNLFNRYSYYFRKYDQADRDQNILNARLNVMARDDLDVGAVIQFKDIHYPDAFYGLEKDTQTALTLDFNYQPSSGTNFSAFFSHQQGDKKMQMNSGVALSPVVNTCTAANLTLYGYSACSDNVNGAGGTRPLSDAWTMSTDDRSDVLGLGMQTTLGTMRFGVDYTYSLSSTAINYSYGDTALSGVAATQAAAAVIAGSALPNMTFAQQTLSLNLLIPVNKKISIRLFDRFEMGDVKDWHYDGVIQGAVANYDSGTLLLDGGPQSYRANVVGVFVQIKL